MKKFTVKFVLFIFPIILIISSVNYFGDAGNIFSSDIEVQIAKYMIEGYNVANVPNIDDRALQRNIINLNKDRPSTIILGSSRIMLIKSDYLQTKSFMNHGVSGASIEDIIAIYQLYKIKGVLPKKIIIGIDPWIFNENYRQSLWKTLEEYYASFLSSNETTQQIFINFEKYFQLISPSYFQSSLKLSIKKLNEQIFNKEKTVLFPTKIKINDTFTRLSDGSISYDLKYRNVTMDDVDNRAKSFISGSIDSLEGYTDFSEKYMHLFYMVVGEMLSNNIEVEFILMPYHPLVYDFLVSKNNYKIVVKVEQYIKEFALNKKISFAGSFNPSKFNLDNSHFYDGMHLNERGVDIILGKPKN